MRPESLRNRCSVWLGSLGFVWLMSLQALADERDSEAHSLFRAGRLALKEGEPEVACESLRKSFQLKQAAGTQLNLAVCEEALGNAARAWELHSGLLETLSPADPRRAVSEERLRDLEPKVARLTLRLSPNAPPESLVVDMATGARVPLDVEAAFSPGSYSFRVSAPGHQAREIRISLSGSEVRALDVQPGTPTESLATGLPPESASAKAAPPAPTPPLARALPPKPSPRDAQVSTHAAPAPADSAATTTWGKLMLGTGAAAFAASGVAALLVWKEKRVFDRGCDPVGPGPQECDPEGLDAAERGRLYSRVGTATFALGVVSAGVGVVLLSGPGVSVSAQLSPSYPRISVSNRF